MNDDDKTLSLHPTEGLNPRLTYCYRCGLDMNEILLVGAHSLKHKCTGCNQVFIGDMSAAKKCCEAKVEKLGELRSTEKIPLGPCEACETELQEHSDVVKLGGIFWKCDDCKGTGAIRHTAPLAQDVRKSVGVEPPDPCGVVFSKSDCPACGPYATVEAGSA